MKIYFLSGYVEKNAIQLDDKTLSDSIKNMTQVLTNAAYLAGATAGSLPIKVKNLYAPTSLYAAFNRNNFQYIFQYYQYCIGEYKRRHNKEHEWKVHYSKIQNLNADPNLNFVVRSKYNKIETLINRSFGFGFSYQNYFQKELKQRTKKYKPVWTATTPPPWSMVR